MFILLPFQHDNTPIHKGRPLSLITIEHHWDATKTLTARFISSEPEE